MSYLYVVVVCKASPHVLQAVHARRQAGQPEEAPDDGELEPPGRGAGVGQVDGKIDYYSIPLFVKSLSLHVSLEHALVIRKSRNC